MKKNILLGLISCVLFLGLSFAQDNAPMTITGVISQVITTTGNQAIVVDGQTIAVSDEMMEEAYFEEGDQVNLEVVKGAKGLELVNYDFGEVVGSMDLGTENIDETTE